MRRHCAAAHLLLDTAFMGIDAQDAQSAAARTAALSDPAAASAAQQTLQGAVRAGDGAAAGVRWALAQMAAELDGVERLLTGNHPVPVAVPAQQVLGLMERVLAMNAASGRSQLWGPTSGVQQRGVFCSLTILADPVMLSRPAGPYHLTGGRSPTGRIAVQGSTCQLISSASSDHSHLSFYRVRKMLHIKCVQMTMHCCAGLQPPSVSAWQELCTALPALQAAALRLVGVLMQATRAALLAHYGAVARLLAGFLKVFCAEQGRLLHTFARPVRQQVRAGIVLQRPAIPSSLQLRVCCPPPNLQVPPGCQTFDVFLPQPLRSQSGSKCALVPLLAD